MRLHHQTMLAIAAAVVLLAFALHVRQDQRVEFRFLPGWPLPQSCTSQAFFGIDCPGCGLTRSLIYAARGQWADSFQMHRLGGLMAIAVLVQFPYRLCALSGCARFLHESSIPKLFGYSLIGLLIANWMVSVIP